MNESQQSVIIAISITVLTSHIYFAFQQKLSLTSPKQIKSRYLIRKVSGFILFGVIPAWVGILFLDLHPVTLFLFKPNGKYFAEIVVITAIILIFINSLNAGNESIQKSYPELRLRKWSTGSLLIEAFGWIIYLLGYEYLFRGILLFTSVDAFGIPTAITINLAIYSGLYLQKRLKEAVAAIPFGALLCYITLESGSVLPAIIIHCIQAISAEMACIYRNREMSFTVTKMKTK